MRLHEIYNCKNGSNSECFPKISLEVFPPKEGVVKYPNLFCELNKLKRYNPAMISLTWGAGGNNNSSLELTGKLKNELQMNIMAHFTCICNSRQNVEAYIKDLELLGINNILALRGDVPDDSSTCYYDFCYANELVKFIKSKTDLSVAVAGYPEGHIDSVDLNSDIENLKRKVDAGADVIYTQLFFDNTKFYSYVEKVRATGIEIPIIPGIMPIISFKQIEKMTSLARIFIPNKLRHQLDKYKEDSASIADFGVEFSTEQCNDLINYGVAGLHFYTLNKADSTAKILDNIR